MKAKERRDAIAKARRLAPFCLCGAQTALTYLRALLAEIDGVQQGGDPECIHRMRVASRRLRSILPLYTTCFARQACARWRKQLRRLTRALGAARDVDVQLDTVTYLRAMGADEIEQAGLGRVLVRLRQQRQILQPAVLTALQRFVDSDVGTAMEQRLTRVLNEHQADIEEHPGRSVYRRMRKAILKRLAALEAYASYVQQSDRLAELHAMRIAAKRLRYTMQAFAPLYQDALGEPVRAARTLQDLLGDVHDSDVWAQQFPTFFEAERARTEAYFGDVEPFTPLVAGILAWQRHRAQFRKQRYQAFVAFWQQLQEQGVWEQLRQALDAPLQRSAEAEQASALRGREPDQGIAPEAPHPA